MNTDMGDPGRSNGSRGSPSEGQPSERQKRPARKRKRICTGETVPKSSRKKHVRGKQGGLQGMMKMPLEIFTEIACYATPGDLVALARTNRLFREILLRQSSIWIWQCAQSSVPDLPPCPTGMCEPQYAAFLFSKTCTLCGCTSTAQPDPYLRVRLCNSCRDTGLEGVSASALALDINYPCVPRSHLIKPSIMAISNHARGITCFCLRRDLEDVASQRAKFLLDDDFEGMAKWEEELVSMVEIRAQEARALLRYILSLSRNRSVELQDIKRERRRTIHKRLIELGWEEAELDFPDHSKKSWNALVHVSKPLTERVWSNILPKLVTLLAENRARIQEARRQERCNKLEALLVQFKWKTHPYRGILEALPKLDPDGSSLSNRIELENCLSAPFPATTTALQWDCMKEIYEEGIDLKRVEELFDLGRAKLYSRLLEWETSIESELIQQYGADLHESGPEVVVTIRGSSDFTRHLSRTTRFLLRADTIFMREGGGNHISLLKQHFPEIASWPRNHQHLSDDAQLGSLANVLPEEYCCSTEIVHIVKGLLKDINMVDAAHAELVWMGRVFVCGRCASFSLQPCTWDNIVWHYREALRLHAAETNAQLLRDTRYTVPLQNIHELGIQSNHHGFVRVLPYDEAKALDDANLEWLNATDPASGSVSRCLLCTYNRLASTSPVEQLRIHLFDVHGIVDAVKDIHFANSDDQGSFQTLDDAEWCKRWDAYNDAEGLRQLSASLQLTYSGDEVACLSSVTQ